MRKTILGALVGSLFAFGGTAHAAPLIFDFDGGGGASNDKLVQTFDWGPTSFLAEKGNTAIRNFTQNNCGAGGANCQFDVYTHATLSGFIDGSGNTGTLPAGFGEITMVAKITEQVINFTNVPGLLQTANFRTTGGGWVQFYWSPANSANLTGANFTDGTLIGQLDGIVANTLGSFTVDLTKAIVALDGTPSDAPPNNDYPGQNTVQGSGAQGNIAFGTLSKDLDFSFFKTLLNDFTLSFENISIGLPYISVDPSNCFNVTKNASAVGSVGNTSECDNVHQLGPYSAQVNATGQTPIVGDTNGFSQDSPDFVAQTDFNSPVTGSVPEPGSLALVGLALAGLGMARRRRQA